MHLRTLLLVAFLLASAIASTAYAGSCCKPTAEPAPKPACCPATPAPVEAALPFTAESLYQLDVSFTDDTGKAFSLGELRGRPVALNLFFASCGYACPLTVTDLLSVQSSLPADVRERTVFVLVSFDTERDTTAVLAQYRQQRQLDGNWIILRGTDDAVRELAALVGVKYKREADGSFAHSNVVTILNAQGEIIHQRLGLKGGLEAAITALTAVQ